MDDKWRYWSRIGSCRWCRHQSLTAATARAKRLLAVCRCLASVAGIFCKDNTHLGVKIGLLDLISAFAMAQSCARKSSPIVSETRTLGEGNADPC